MQGKEFIALLNEYPTIKRRFQGITTREEIPPIKEGNFILVNTE